MIRRPPRSTHCISSAASDVYKRQVLMRRQPEPRDWRKGSRVLVDEGGTCLATWFGSKVTPMVNEQEMRVMRAVRGLPIVLDEEE